MQQIFRAFPLLRHNEPLSMMCRKQIQWERYSWFRYFKVRSIRFLSILKPIFETSTKASQWMNGLDWNVYWRNSQPQGTIKTLRQHHLKPVCIQRNPWSTLKQFSLDPNSWNRCCLFCSLRTCNPHFSISAIVFWSASCKVSFSVKFINRLAAGVCKFNEVQIARAVRTAKGKQDPCFVFVFNARSVDRENIGLAFPPLLAMLFAAWSTSISLGSNFCTWCTFAQYLP